MPNKQNKSACDLSEEEILSEILSLTSKLLVRLDASEKTALNKCRTNATLSIRTLVKGLRGTGS